MPVSISNARLAQFHQGSGIKNFIRVLANSSSFGFVSVNLDGEALSRTVRALSGLNKHAMHTVDAFFRAKAHRALHENLVYWQP